MGIFLGTFGGRFRIHESMGPWLLKNLECESIRIRSIRHFLKLMDSGRIPTHIHVYLVTPRQAWQGRSFPLWHLCSLGLIEPDDFNGYSGSAFSQVHIAAGKDLPGSPVVLALVAHVQVLMTFAKRTALPD